MAGEVSAEQARKILDMLTNGEALENVNTTLALRLIPLAEELDDPVLVQRLLDHAIEVSSDKLESGWADFEILKLINFCDNKLIFLSVRHQLLSLSNFCIYSKFLL